MDERRTKQVTDFGDARLQQKLDDVKKKQNPVGHVPMPTMPRLDQPVPHDRFKGVQGAKSPQGQQLLTPEQMAALKRQGQLIPGVGSAYMANQPAANPPSTRQARPAVPGDAPGPAAPLQPPRAAEPVVRPGPQIPEVPATQLSPETTELLVQATSAATSQEKQEQALVAEVNKVDEEEFESNAFGDRVRTLFNNKQRRQAIEGRCDPLKLEDLLTQYELRQTVPIVPNVFFPTFRTSTVEEVLFIKRVISEPDNERSSSYVLDKFSVLLLTLGLYALNGKLLPDHRSAETGKVDAALFKAKEQYINRLPESVLEDLSANLLWFRDRVARLTVIDEIKGF